MLKFTIKEKDKKTAQIKNYKKFVMKYEFTILW